MGFLVFLQCLVTITSRRIRNGIETGGVKSDHAQQSENQNHSRRRRGIDDIQNQLIQVSIGSIHAYKIRRTAGLTAQTIITKDDERNDGRTHAEGIATENSLLYRASAGYVPNKKVSATLQPPNPHSWGK